MRVDREITKWDIFYYVYGLLHHPGYRERYSDNLKRELPRIPFAPDFWAFSEAGKKLADLHLHYETVKPYELEWATKNPVSYRVEKMRPQNVHRGGSQTLPYTTFDSLQVNDTLTLKGIPAEAFEYRLGNRSALDWVIDQYQVSTDKRSGITSDPTVTVTTNATLSIWSSGWCASASRRWGLCGNWPRCRFGRRNLRVLVACKVRNDFQQ